MSGKAIGITIGTIAVAGVVAVGTYSYATGGLAKDIPAVESVVNRSKSATATAVKKEPAKNGWIDEDGGRRYYKDDRYMTGVTNVEGTDMHFDSKGHLTTGEYKVDKNAFYSKDDGTLIAYIKGDKYYYSDGKSMSEADKWDFKAQVKAHHVVDKLTTDDMSDEEKLKTCFMWVMDTRYVKHRKFDSTVSYWPAYFACDIFKDRTGECHADGSAVAYIAAAIGYKDVYVCRDTASHNVQGHCWAEINGRVYDSLFAKSRGFSKFYNVPYEGYTGRARDHIKVPKFTGKQSSSDNTKVKKETPAKTVDGWDDAKQHLYYSDGTMVKGVTVFEREFYDFDDDGNLDQAKTDQIRAAATRKNKVSELEALIGEPKSKDYEASCYGTGKDGTWQYDSFKIATYKPKEGDGDEIFMNIMR